jgi:hypothetical protein
MMISLSYRAAKVMCRASVSYSRRAAWASNPVAHCGAATCCLPPAGCFPFDHVDNPDPNSRSAQMEVWAQQVHGRWHDLPAVAAVVNRVWVTSGHCVVHEWCSASLLQCCLMRPRL